MEMSLIAGVLPKNAVRCFVTMHGLSASADLSGASATAGRGTVTCGITRAPRATSIDWSTESGFGGEPGGETDHENDRDQHQGTRPSLCMPFVVCADSVRKDLERKRGDRLPHRSRPELIAERREQQGRGLSGDSCHGDESAGSDPANAVRSTMEIDVRHRG